MQRYNSSTQNSYSPSEVTSAWLTVQHSDKFETRRQLSFSLSLRTLSTIHVGVFEDTHEMSSIRLEWLEWHRAVE